MRGLEGGGRKPLVHFSVEVHDVSLFQVTMTW